MFIKNLPLASAVTSTDKLVVEQPSGTKQVAAGDLAAAMYPLAAIPGIADHTDSAKGAGIVGWGSGLSYPVNSVGWEINNLVTSLGLAETLAHAAATYQTISAGETSAHAAATYQTIAKLASTTPGQGIDLVNGSEHAVDSISALKALLKTGNGHAFVTGYYAAGDGGGGPYYYDASDTTSTDNGGTIIVATDGGRWKLAWFGQLSVKQFGAKGDGANDDTSAIQAALNAAGIGRVVFLPKGQYKITGTLTLLQSQKLVGESTLAAFKSNLYLQLSTINVYVGQGGTTTPAVLLDLGSGVHGVSFNHPNQVAPSVAAPIQFGWTIATDTSKSYNIDDVTIRDVMFVNAYMGISLDNSGRFNVENVYGDCIKEGVFVDRSGDASRMSHVHIWPFTYTNGTNMMTWIAANGRAFNFNRADGMVGLDLFQYGRNIAFDFNDNGNGAFWGDLFGCLSDVANFPVKIGKVARLRWFGGSLIPYLAAQPCVTTSSDVTTASQGSAYVLFDGTQFHDTARIGAVITSSTGRFNFTDCDFERAEVTVINTSTALVNVQNAKTRFGTNSRLTAIGDGAYLTWNGIPNPIVGSDISPSNFGMTAFVGGTPTNWVFRVGTNASIANLGGGTVKFLYNSATTASIGYNLPTSITQKPGVYLMLFTLAYSGITDGKIIIHCRRNDLTNEQSVRLFDSANHTGTYSYAVPVVVGYDSGGTINIEIEWVTQSGTIGAGFAQMANIALYNCADANIKQDALDSIMRREFLDPFVIGPPIAKPGSNRIVQQATAAPTVGTWLVNDRVLRYPQVVGSPKAWVCTVAGTPGTWVSEGNL